MFVKFWTQNISYKVWNVFLDAFVYSPLVQICSILRTNGALSFSLSTLYGQQNYTVCLSVFINCLYFGISLYIISSCRTVLTNQTATVPPIEKNVYLLRRKGCARFRLNFSILLHCQVKIPDEKNTRHVYLLGRNINKPLVHFY